MTPDMHPPVSVIYCKLEVICPDIRKNLHNLLDQFVVYEVIKKSLTPVIIPHTGKDFL
ncbi:hypothetical protein [Methanosarcina mazei]|nr:hypothetical protein [Methanosarcina mazei]